MSIPVPPWVPVALLFAVTAWGVFIRRSCRFTLPHCPIWPFAELPGLALELAASQDDVSAAIGPPASPERPTNTVAAEKLQRLDFFFILLYVIFFIGAAAAIGSGPWFWPIVISSILTGLLDVMEDLQILRMLHKGIGSARPFGRLKWLLYFLTLGTEGLLIFGRYNALSPLFILASILVVAIAAGGAISSARGNFDGIFSASKLSSLAILAIAFTPFFAATDGYLRFVVEYAMLMRISLLIAALLIALPVISFFSGAKSLLRGLFDLTPVSLFVVTLTTVAVSGTACTTAALVLAHASERFSNVPDANAYLPQPWQWLVLLTVLASPILLSATVFSIRLRTKFARPPSQPTWNIVTRYLIAGLSALSIGLAISGPLSMRRHEIAQWTLGFISLDRFEMWLHRNGLFHGYANPGSPADPFIDQVAAAITLAAVLILYAIVGVYGWSRLGKRRTVPALASALMIVLLLGWMLAAGTFFFDAWRVPVLLIVVLVGTLTAQSSHSDHFYDLLPRNTRNPLPDPAATLLASQRKRLIVVAANGGGIQASAWTARVLSGLSDFCGPDFQQTLRATSSVSGGSVGNMYFVHSLANPQTAQPPFQAATASSLDEVAWGLAWPDFLRGLFPWLLGGLIGRGRALEQAWVANGSKPGVTGQLDRPLSEWNPLVAQGQLPAVILNATVAETGDRLLLATTDVTHNELTDRAQVDAATLHTVNGTPYEVKIVTAARLSATFPYVTPAARANAPGPQPHIVDGGYYDNYGMASLVDWLDEGLTAGNNRIESVLVLQLRGSPSDTNRKQRMHSRSRGWFYQAIAPLTTIVAVRGAGQIAHNDIELQLLQQKWGAAGIAVHSIPFEFSNPDAPLSWHLTAEDIAAIESAWTNDMDECKTKVQQFLAGSDALQCGCPRCSPARDSKPISAKASAAASTGGATVLSAEKVTFVAE